MCDDITATVRELRAKGIEVQGEPKDEGWGISVVLALQAASRCSFTNPATLSLPKSLPKAARKG